MLATSYRAQLLTACLIRSSALQLIYPEISFLGVGVEVSGYYVPYSIPSTLAPSIQDHRTMVELHKAMYDLTTSEETHDIDGHC